MPHARQAARPPPPDDTQKRSINKLSGEADDMRYAVALLVACALIGLGALFTWHTQSQLQHRIHKSLEEAKQSGELADVDMNAAQPGGFDVELSKSDFRRVQIANLLASFWFLLVPLTIGVCLAVAAIVKRKG